MSQSQPLDKFKKKEIKVRILDINEIIQRSEVGPVGAAYPKCEHCRTSYMIGADEVFHIRNYECASCGKKWGADYLDSEALEAGGVFFQNKEPLDQEYNGRHN